MKLLAKRRLEEELSKNPPGDLTDSKVVGEMNRQIAEQSRDQTEVMDRLSKNSIAHGNRVIG